MKDYILDLDKPRELRYGFAALNAIENKFGKKDIEQIIATIKVSEAPTLILAGLKWADSQLNIDRVVGLLDEAIPGKYKIMEVILLALNALADHMGVDVKKALADAKVAEKEEAEETKAETAKKKKVTETIPSSKKQKK